jgi:hypothetical protein
MKIECSNDVFSAGDKRIQSQILNVYSQLINKTTDVAIPFYKLEASKFEKIWPPTKRNHEECDFWKNILYKQDDINRRRKDKYLQFLEVSVNGVCSGELQSECSVVFLDDVKYIKWSGVEFIQSPGIYIKDPFQFGKHLYDFMIAYNMHLAETYYLSNRKATTEQFNSKDILHFKSFIMSLLTIKSLYQISDKIVKELVFHDSRYLVGSWKVPFLILQGIPEDEWNLILSDSEIIAAIEDLLSGSPLGDTNIRIKRILDSLLY